MTAWNNTTAALGIETGIELLREPLSAHSMLGTSLGFEEKQQEKDKQENIAGVREKIKC